MEEKLYTKKNLKLGEIFFKRKKSEIYKNYLTKRLLFIRLSTANKFTFSMIKFIIPV